MRRTYSHISGLLLIALACGCTTSGSKKTDSKLYTGHGAASVAPEILEKYSPAPLDKDLERKISSLLDITAPGSGIVAPDGRSLFFSWRVTGVPQVWRVDGESGFPVQMTSGLDVTSPQAVTPDGRYIVISRDRNGEENPGLYLQAVSGGPLREIQHRAGARTFLQWVSDDSQWVYFVSNDIKPDSYALYRWNVKSGSKELLFDEPGLWFLSDVKDGRFLLSKSTGARWREYYEYNPSDRKLTPLFGQNEKEEYRALFGSKKGEYLVRTNRFGDFHRLYRWQSGHFEPLTAERKMELGGFFIDDRRERIYLHWNDNGFTRLEAVDARTLKPLTLPIFKGADHIYASGTTRNGRFVTLGVETSREPRASYVFDWQTRRLSRRVLPSVPEVDTSTYAVAKLEFYPARDGTPIPMLVRRPASCQGPCPVIVNFHGGPESQSVPGFSTRAQMFVDAGFIFVEPNVRGSDGYGKTWLSADDGPKRLNVITDIEDAARYIRKAWAKNGKEPRVGVMGGSYGGYAALMAMTKFAGAYDAAVSIVGMSDLRTFLNNTAPYRRILRTSEYGDPEKDAEALAQLSPITWLNQTRDPLLIIQGVSDPRVPAGEAIQMHQALEKKGIPSELILFADEGHGTSKRVNQVLQVGHTLRFFEKHMLNPTASDKESLPRKL